MFGIKKPASPQAKAQCAPLAPKLWGALNADRNGLVLLNSAGQIMQFNDEAKRLLHCEDADLSGRDFWCLLSPEIAQKQQPAFLDAEKRGEPHSFAVKREVPLEWVEFTFNVYPEATAVVLKDVTTEKNLQRLLFESLSTKQLMFNANPNAMWICDPATSSVIDVNQAAIDFYGIPKSNFLGLKLGALFPDGTGAALFDSIRSEDACKVVLQICKQVKGDGTVVLVELACSRITVQGLEAMLVSLADVTERHLSDRKLRRENTQLKQLLARQNEELSGARRDVAAVISALSHNLQVPLHVANGFASILDEKYGMHLDDAGRHYIHRIQASTRKMSEMADDLRTLMLLPQSPGELEKLDLSVLGNSILRELQSHDSGRAVVWEIQAGSFIYANRRTLSIALTCLLGNAWKFTAKRAEAWIKVAVVPGPTPGELVLQVSDNGEGFDAAHSDKLFMAFQRLHSSADYPGNGLGLVTVKRVAERHGGRVWAESTPTGASFFMALPQTQAVHTSQLAR